MADEKIVIQIVDKIDASIVRKLEAISANAMVGQKAVDNLQLALGKKNVSNETLKQATAIERLKTATNNAKTSGEKFATQQARTATVLAQATNAQNRAAISAANLSKAQSQAALSALKLQNAQNRAASMPTKGTVGGGGLSSLVGMAKGAVAGYLGYQGIQEVTGLASAYTELQNKLKNVTDSEAQLNTVTEKVFEIANKTRVPVGETAQAFQRFDLALKQLGASQGESLRMTETVNKMLIVSGATAGESGSALLQLSQAFNKGKLDGDEFRSVMELMPPVADAIAKKLGVTRGELLKLAPQGKITAQVMREALADVADTVDEKFGKTIPTLSQSFTILKNTLIQVFGEINKESGILSEVGLWIRDIGKFAKENKDELGSMVTSLYETSKALLQVSTAFTEVINTSDGLKLLADVLDQIATGWKAIAASMKDAAKYGPHGFIKNLITGDPMENVDKFVVDRETKMRKEAHKLFMEQMGGNQIAKDLEELQARIAPTLGDVIKINVNEMTGPAKLANDVDKLGKTIKIHLDSFEKMNTLLSKGSPEYIMPRGADTFSDIINPAQISTKFVPEPKDDLLNRLGFAPEVMGAVETQFNTIAEKYRFFYGQLDIMRSADSKNEKKYVDASVKLKKQEVMEKMQYSSEFFGNMSHLMQSNSKDVFRIGKAAALAQAGIDATGAIIKALNSPPGGWASVAMATSIGAMAAVQMANIANAQPPGFKEGGFTGYAGTSQVAGVVHGQEFVSNAAATSKYRPMLERMNKGGAAIAVTIENYGTSKEFEVQQITPDQVRIIARDEIRTQTPSIVASEVMNPNSRVSKAFNNSTSLQRKRV